LTYEFKVVLKIIFRLINCMIIFFIAYSSFKCVVWLLTVPTFLSWLQLIFELPAALTFTPVTNMLLYGLIIITTGKFTPNVNWAHQTYSAVTGVTGYSPY